MILLECTGGGNLSEFQDYLDSALKNCELNKDDVSYLRKSISTQIISRRNEMGITQKELSGLTGIKQSNISKIENADYNITIEVLEKIANALNCKVQITFEDDLER